MDNKDLLKDVFDHFSYRGVIGFIVVLGSYGFLFALLRVKIPPENRESINTAMGFVLLSLGIVIGYYFGTSKDQSDTKKAENVSQVLTAAKDKEVEDANG